MYFWTLNSNVFPEFHYHPQLSLQVIRAGIFCARTLRCVFTVGAMNNSRISSPSKMVSCFAMMFVPSWKFLVMNITQINGACSLIRQKWAWRWFYSTTEIGSLPFLWLMQSTWRKVMKAWNYRWEILSMTILSVNYVVISRLWQCYSESNSGTQITAVSCANGTAGTSRITV